VADWLVLGWGAVERGGLGWGGDIDSCEGGVINELLVGPICLGDAAGGSRVYGSSVVCVFWGGEGGKGKDDSYKKPVTLLSRWL
jgi:hypothetical protein